MNSVLPAVILFSSLTAQHSSLSGEEIIAQMQKKWQGKWGRNMRFDQKVFHYHNDHLVKEEEWQEVLSSPGNLHIRFNGFESGNGILFRKDSVYHFRDHHLVQTENRVHHLLLLGFDVFFLSPEETVNKLQKLGFDLEKTYERETENGPVYVVGTDNFEDNVSSQFWIDRKNLYLTKVLLNRNDSPSEVEMTNYQFIDSYPAATVVLFKNNGQLVMKEEYYDISFPENLDPTIFDPENFKTTRW